MASYERLDYGSPDGCLVGGASTDKVALHGATPVVQASAITTVVSGTAATTATYGTVNPDIAAIIVAVNAIVVALRNKGITAT